MLCHFVAEIYLFDITDLGRTNMSDTSNQLNEFSICPTN